MTARIIVGDALEQLRLLPDESADLIATSPPYWRQRDYGCAGQIGLEATPEEYVDRLVAVFAEARRVLRSTGSAWVNIGDKWAASGNGGGGSYMDERKSRAWKHAAVARGWRAAPPGYKRKDLIGLPFMLAFAMRGDGWYWRSTEIWAKANGMPESVRDRPVIAHEYVLQFSKGEDYFFDPDAVRLPAVPESVGRLERAMRGALDAGNFVMSGGGYAPAGQAPHSGARRSDKQRGHSRRHAGFNDRWDAMPRTEQQARGAMLRSVWWLPVANSTEEHFAVMPDELAAAMILSACPSGGTVLDPFFGVGTTGLVADRLGRHCIGIELDPANVERARTRIRRDATLLAEVV